MSDPEISIKTPCVFPTCFQLLLVQILSEPEEGTFMLCSQLCLNIKFSRASSPSKQRPVVISLHQHLPILFPGDDYCIKTVVQRITQTLPRILISNQIVPQT